MQIIQKKCNSGRNDPCPCGAKKTNEQPKKYKHCCLKASQSQNLIKQKENSLKTYFKTLSVETLPLELSTREFCLDLLFSTLDKITSQKLIYELAFIGRTLDGKDVLGAHEKLIQKYASKSMREDLVKDSTKNGIFLLFNKYALRLIDELLRVDISDRTILLDDHRTNSESLFNNMSLSLGVIENKLQTLEGLFLLANTLIPEIENKTFFPATEDDEKTRIFLSRRPSLKPSAIGRSRIYRYEGFPSKLQKIDLEVEDYFKAAFALCALVEKHDVAELEIPGSFNQVISCKDILEKYILLLSANIKEERLPEKSSLAKLYYTNQLCRQRPLLQIDNRYYCLQPHLLWAALSDLPFYLLLDSCKNNKKEGDALWQFYGDLFEKNWRDLSARVFGIDKCEDFECKNKHPDLNLFEKKHRIGDCLVTLDEDTKVIFEFKGATLNDSIKLGSKNKLFTKFIELEEGAGISQLCIDATAYRRETSFNGSIFIVLVSRGPLPLTSTLDYEVENYLSKHLKYQSYLLNCQNQPVIWMDENGIELLFSALRQGIPFKETIKILAGALPSKIPELIYERVQHYRLNFSSIDLYKEEIQAQVISCQTMFF